MKTLMKLLASLILVVGMWSCTHPAWEEHYSSNTGNVIDKTLKEALESDPELSSFVDFLKAEDIDYLDIFGHSQSYTIWAPTNEAWEGFDASDRDNLFQTLKNHVSRYPYLTTDVPAEGINLHLMDNKYIRFSRQGDKFYFGSQELIASDASYKNGILHKISGVEPYVPNVYEYIQLTPGLDSLKQFINQYHTSTFDEANSLVLGVDENGQTMYDSVFIESNPLISNYMEGINDENASLTALLPNNEAWKDMYDIYYPYVKLPPFEFPLPAIGDPIIDQVYADSLQDRMTKIFMLRYLVYTPAMTQAQIQQQGPIFSESMQLTHIEEMNLLFENAYDTYTELSNGVAYTTHKLNIDPSTWCTPIKLEAEQFYNHYYLPNAYIDQPDSMSMALQKVEENSRNLYKRDSKSSWLNDSISENAYLEVAARNDQVAPVVSFDFSNENILSNLKYNVKVVFLPDRLFNKKKPVEDLKPVPVRFDLSYLNEQGGITTKNYRTVQYTDPLHADTILVTDEPVEFVYANSLAYLKVISDIQPLQDSVYARDMLIDCIILEPVY